MIQKFRLVCQTREVLKVNGILLLLFLRFVLLLVEQLANETFEIIFPDGAHFQPTTLEACATWNNQLERSVGRLSHKSRALVAAGNAHQQLDHSSTGECKSHVQLHQEHAGSTA